MGSLHPNLKLERKITRQVRDLPLISIDKKSVRPPKGQANSIKVTRPNRGALSCVGEKAKCLECLRNLLLAHVLYVSLYRSVREPQHRVNVSLPRSQTPKHAVRLVATSAEIKRQCNATLSSQKRLCESISSSVKPLLFKSDSNTDTVRQRRGNRTLPPGEDNDVNDVEKQQYSDRRSCLDSPPSSSKSAPDINNTFSVVQCPSWHHFRCPCCSIASWMRCLSLMCCF